MKISHVPHKSQDQVPATFMPDATQAVNRFPLDLSWNIERTPVLTPSITFRHLISGSLTLDSLIHTCHDPMPWLFLNAHHHGFWPQQLKAVWSLLLQAGSEGPNPHLLCSYAQLRASCPFLRAWRTIDTLYWFWTGYRFRPYFSIDFEYNCMISLRPITARYLRLETDM